MAKNITNFGSLSQIYFHPPGVNRYSSSILYFFFKKYLTLLIFFLFYWAKKEKPQDVCQIIPNFKRDQVILFVTKRCYTPTFHILYADSKYMTLKKSMGENGGQTFLGQGSQALPPILEGTKWFESFPLCCQILCKGLAHRALKVSAIHFCSVDCFKSYTFRITIKNGRIWCLANICQTIFNLKCFSVGFEMHTSHQKMVYHCQVKSRKRNCK